jgi:hypothetical protein
MSSVLLASPVAHTQTDTETETRRQTERHADMRDHPRIIPTLLPCTHTAQTHTARTHARAHTPSHPHTHTAVPTQADARTHSSPHAYKKNFLSYTYVSHESFQITDRCLAGPRCCGRNSSHTPALALAPVRHHFFLLTTWHTECKCNIRMLYTTRMLY